jgi:hypothetical protein
LPAARVRLRVAASATPARSLPRGFLAPALDEMALTCAQFWGCHCLPERILWRICAAGVLVSVAQSILGLVYGSLGWVIVGAVGVASGGVHAWGLAAHKASVVKHLPGHFVGQNLASIIAITMFKDAAGIAVNSVCLAAAVVAAYTAARLHALWAGAEAAPPVLSTTPQTDAARPETALP